MLRPIHSIYTIPRFDINNNFIVSDNYYSTTDFISSNLIEFDGYVLYKVFDANNKFLYYLDGNNFNISLEY
jgi:hypothetical protein